MAELQTLEDTLVKAKATLTAAKDREADTKKRIAAIEKEMKTFAAEVGVGIPHTLGFQQ